MKFHSSECVGDSRLRCDLVDVYYALFGTRRPLCFLDDGHQHDEAPSRRKSAITTREVVDEFKKVMIFVFVFSFSLLCLSSFAFDFVLVVGEFNSR